jgi:hypothetical protein
MNKGIKLLSCLFFLLFISFKSLAISTNPNIILVGDTSEKAVKKAANKQAHRAAVMSAILPGLGQAYNKKFWKIPIVYAALAAGSYLLYYESSQYQLYHKELQIRYRHGDSLATGGYIQYGGSNKLANFSTDNVNTEKVLYEKYRDFSIVGVVIIYALNVIDASVDGHFKTFDVSDNLSMTIKPKTFFCAQSPFNLGAGISLSLRFK